jgi:hypothetical protein
MVLWITLANDGYHFTNSLTNCMLHFLSTIYSYTFNQTTEAGLYCICKILPLNPWLPQSHSNSHQPFLLITIITHSNPLCTNDLWEHNGAIKSVGLLSGFFDCTNIIKEDIKLWSSSLCNFLYSFISLGMSQNFTKFLDVNICIIETYLIKNLSNHEATLLKTLPAIQFLISFLDPEILKYITLVTQP